MYDVNLCAHGEIGWRSRASLLPESRAKKPVRTVKRYRRQTESANDDEDRYQSVISDTRLIQFKNYLEEVMA